MTHRLRSEGELTPLITRLLKCLPDICVFTTETAIIDAYPSYLTSTNRHSSRFDLRMTCIGANTVLFPLFDAT